MTVNFCQSFFVCIKTVIRQRMINDGIRRNILTSNQLCAKTTNPYPPLNEAELEEQFVQGEGPGGQAVNKTNNCVVLKHIPTGCVVKCHETRSLIKNRERARLHLQEKLDWHFNRENSIISQEKRAASVELKEKKRRTNKKLELLRQFKEREGIE